MSWYDRLNIFKAHPVRDNKSDPRVSVSTVRGTIGHQTTPRAMAFKASEMMSHPVVSRCIYKIGEAVQTVRWFAEADPNYTGTVEDKSIQDIQDVLDFPTDDFTPEMMRYWMAANLAFHMRFSFKVGLGFSGQPNALYPIQAGTLTTILDNKGRVKGYKVGDQEKNNNKVTPSRREASPDKDLTKYPAKAYIHEVLIPGLSATPNEKPLITRIHAANNPAVIINMLYERAYETAAGAPNSKYILVGDKNLTAPQRQEVENFLAESSVGGSESGNVLSLFNTDINVITLDNDMSDIHTKIPSDDMSRLIFGIFGIPISMGGIGGADAAKFANNYGEGRRSFYEDTIIPGYLTPIQSGLTAGICPPGVRIRFDIDSIPALEEAKAERAKTLSKVTFLTDDEKRALCGYAASITPTTPTSE